MQVFSGYDDSGPSYGRFCGNKIPPEIISVDEALLLRYYLYSVLLFKYCGSVFDMYASD